MSKKSKKGPCEWGGDVIDHGRTQPVDKMLEALCESSRAGRCNRDVEKPRESYRERLKKLGL